jgi:hypothetical protein
MQRSLRLVLLSVLAVAPAAGCIPWVSVPARVELAPMQALVTRAPDGPAGSDAPRGMRFRAAICPLGGANQLHGRSFDVGLGYQYDSYHTFSRNSFGHHGLLLEGTYYVFRSSSEGPIWRLGILGSAEGVLTSFRDDAKAGPGITTGLLWEYSNVASGFGAERNGDVRVVGAGYGEWGWGISLTGNYAQLDGRDYLAALLGLYLRFPFGAGVVVLGH